MATIQSSGVGSGLDIAGLVQQLVAAERQPLDARLNRRETAASIRLSALGSLRGALATLRDALAPMRAQADFQLRTARSSDDSAVSVSATPSAQPVVLAVEVLSLASADKLASGAFGAADSYVGDGTLTIGVGDASFAVEIAPGTGTLAGIRDAINAASGNTLVSASIVNETGGSRLVLTGQRTGADAVIAVAQSGGDGGLAALVRDPQDPGAGGLTVITPAADARIRIDGFEHRSAGDVVTGAVDGLTITLRKAQPGTVHTLTVANDTSGVLGRVRRFVADFNALARVLGGVQKFDPSTRTAGPLIGDSLVRRLESEIRRDVVDLTGAPDARYRSLTALGITTDASGALQIDETKLAAALSADQAAVIALFAGESGVAGRLHARLEAALSETGPLAERARTLDRQVAEVGRDREAVDRRMASLRARYQAQFTALDRLLAQLQTTSGYLTRQLDSLDAGGKRA